MLNSNIKSFIHFKGLEIYQEVKLRIGEIIIGLDPSFEDATLSKSSKGTYWKNV